MASGTTAFTSLLVNVGATREIASKIMARAELGFGAMVISGLDVAGNVFLQDGLVADGAVSSGNFRLALGAEYAVTPEIAVSVQPIVINSAVAPDGLRQGIDALNTFQALIGVGYRM